MMTASVIMGVVSYQAGASAGVIALRVMAVMVVLQLGYFLLLLLMSLISPPKPADTDSPAQVDPQAGTQKQ
ncbi:hypothetical protein L0664_05020 [Octadecabacter sp. G9-8]|uniref:Uncharacterized protein n=2 Tax=Octadecabacter dasysiphoniae TaxID=2909341 RepID=A0ABS9CW68_9RHOB|nr:hypothetical protein [Octadecabacter dasysiphoniae]